MALDYDVACREGDLGAMLTAAFLQQEGCRVLLLPPLPVDFPDPGFLLPVVRGYPARLLAKFVDLKLPADPFFSWQSGSKVQSWPVSTSAAGEVTVSEVESSTLNPGLWRQLDNLWHLIDSCMEQNLNMPANSITGFWQMFLLLVKSELLRESRRHTLDSWLDEAGIAATEQCQWRSLVPLISLYRFNKLPLLAFAYGVNSLLQPASLVDITALKRKLFVRLIADGAESTTEMWGPVFDGKWYIGVGNDNMVSRRSTVYLADSNPDCLLQEIPVSNQRHDFKRQLRLEDPGFLHRQMMCDQNTPLKRGDALYHLICSESANLDKSQFFTPVLGSDSENGTGERLIQHSWQAVADKKEIDSGDCWGWQPRLPAMMGGGFLPLTGSFCRFYRVGWHNLPGFGLGGLVYSARQASSLIMANEIV